MRCKDRSSGELLARMSGRQTVALSDREELAKFITEARDREKASMAREDTLSKRMDAFIESNRKMATQVALLEQTRVQLENDLEEMRQAWAHEQTQWEAERIRLLSRIQKLEDSVNGHKR